MKTIAQRVHILHHGHEEPPQHGYHDYNPSWDYELTALPRAEQLDDLKKAIEEADADLLDALKFPGAVVFLAETRSLQANTHGVYADGTSQFPFIGLSMERLHDACEDTGNDFSVQIKATLAHELAHAWLEAQCSDDLSGDTEEQLVEEFAFTWVVHGQVDVSILESAIASPAP
ncbi:protein DA1 [Thalassospira xianhensis]|uniref:Neutral zinc metallopeptidase n=1 Tax=Thalassospira xianhensis MCCC 1A02616 TaxID=1177929 RepID=A0A367UDP9_9PROT|nr:protein DA1 [Thalassospira xianhensis]RCK06358.1 hypothetical protein TH5_09165 [Thalassospira xianhensis MCCC 1A02616]